jgi:tRNA(Ile)-lysidine synthase
LLYARNRIRLRLLPELAAKVPCLRQRLLKIAGNLRAIFSGLQVDADSLLANSRAQNGSAAPPQWIELPLDLPYNPLLLDELLWQAMQRIGVPMGKISQHHFDLLHRLIDRKAGSLRRQLPAGFAAECRQNSLWLGRLESEAGLPAEIPLAIPGETPVHWLNLNLTSEVIVASIDPAELRRQKKNAIEEVFDDAQCKRPLVLRPWRAGDRMLPLGGPGERKVQDILTDLKIPRSLRTRMLILVSGNQPIWLVGPFAEGRENHIISRIDDRVKVAGQTRQLLRLKINKTSF